MPLISDKNTLLIRCKCHGHVLEISCDDYDMEDRGVPDFDISVWNQTPAPFSFWQRIQMIYTLVMGRNLDGGDVIIDREDAEVIIQFLTEKLIANQNKMIYNKPKQVPIDDGATNSKPIVLKFDPTKRRIP
jgi:hypothetical protein